MVQIIEENRLPTKLDRFLQMTSSGLQGGAEGIGALKGAMNERKEREALAGEFGDIYRDIRNPNIRSQLLTGDIQKRNQADKLRGEYTADEEGYNIMKEAFGEKFANVWKSTGQGERTNLTKAALEAKARGLDLNQLLENVNRQNNQEPISSEKSKSPIKKGEIPEYKLNTEGMTPKEIVDFKSNLRKENTPIWKETIDNLGDFKDLDRDISILEKINEKQTLPEGGLEKLLIDPETGAPYARAELIKTPNRDVQQWAKTIARQATKARTAFPGRVTNFDLSAYMRQFPSLFNTYEGRKVILNQMRLTNKAELLLTKAMDKVYSKYKLSGITPEDAFEQARSMVEDELEDIDNQLINLADEGEILSSQGENLSGRMVDVIGPDGQVYEIDESEVGDLPQGFRIQ